MLFTSKDSVSLTSKDRLIVVDTNRHIFRQVFVEVRRTLEVAQRQRHFAEGQRRRVVVDWAWYGAMCGTVMVNNLV